MSVETVDQSVMGSEATAQVPAGAEGAPRLTPEQDAAQVLFAASRDPEKRDYFTALEYQIGIIKVLSEVRNLQSDAMNMAADQDQQVIISTAFNSFQKAPPLVIVSTKEMAESAGAVVSDDLKKIEDVANAIPSLREKKLLTNNVFTTEIEPPLKEPKVQQGPVDENGSEVSSADESVQIEIPVIELKSAAQDYFDQINSQHAEMHEELIQQIKDAQTLEGKHEHVLLPRFDNETVVGFQLLSWPVIEPSPLDMAEIPQAVERFDGADDTKFDVFSKIAEIPDEDEEERNKLELELSEVLRGERQPANVSEEDGFLEAVERIAAQWVTTGDHFFALQEDFTGINSALLPNTSLSYDNVTAFRDLKSAILNHNNGTGMNKRRTATVHKVTTDTEAETFLKKIYTGHKSIEEVINTNLKSRIERFGKENLKLKMGRSLLPFAVGDPVYIDNAEHIILREDDSDLLLSIKGNETTIAKSAIEEANQPKELTAGNVVSYEDNEYIVLRQDNSDLVLSKIRREKKSTVAKENPFHAYTIVDFIYNMSGSKLQWVQRFFQGKDQVRSADGIKIPNSYTAAQKSLVLRVGLPIIERARLLGGGFDVKYPDNYIMRLGQPVSFDDKQWIIEDIHTDATKKVQVEIVTVNTNGKIRERMYVLQSELRKDTNAADGDRSTTVYPPSKS